MTLQEKILSVIVKNSNELIIVFDERGTIINANDTAMEETGFTENMAGRNVTEFYPLAIDNSEEIISLKNDFEFERDFETTCYCKNQTCFPVLLKVIRYYYETGVMFFSYGINIRRQKHAIREQQTAMEKLEEATRMRNEFMANVTHEMRTPVNGMKGLATTLLDTELNPGQRETVGIIIRCCENMTKIINDILDFSKIEAGKLNIEKREFDFRKFLDETLAIHSPRINEKGLKFIVNVGSDIPDMLIGDELRLGQVLNNLFSNAVKFTSSGHIALEIVNTAHTDNEVELFFMVIDTGIGIAKEDADKLFKSFSQVDGSITRRFGGTGLGLAITKQLVEAMGGTIHVESEKDKGSSFSFSVKMGIGKSSSLSGTMQGYRYSGEKYTYGSKQSLPATEYESSIAGIEDAGDWKEQAEKFIEKLNICVEMGTWAKAEGFAGNIKSLMPADNQELKRNAFRLEMNVRKEDYEKTMQQIDILSKLLKG